MRKQITFFIILITIFCTGARAGQSVFPVVGWQLHHADEEHINRMVDLAAQYGVNHLQLSHSIIMDIDTLVHDSERSALIRRVTQRAHEKGIRVYAWTHEFNTDQMPVCLDPEEKSGRRFWENRQDDYRAAFAQAPELDGVIMSFGSSSPDPWSLFCTCAWCRKHDNADRVALILEQLGGVVAGEFGKTLYARTFIHTPDELEWVGDALRRTPPATGPAVMSKDVPQDWEPYYPHNPIIGNNGGHPQIVEMDLGGEYWGKSAFPMDLADYLQHRIRHARDNNAAGFVVRVERGGDSLFGTSNELNLYAFHELLKNPDMNTDEIRGRWIADKYDIEPRSPDARRLMHIFKSSFDAVRKMYYVLGFWALEKGSDLTTSATYPALLSGRSIALYDPAFLPRQKLLETVTPDTFDRIMREKSEAVDIAERMLQELEQVTTMNPEDFRQLKSELETLARATRVWRLANGALWAFRLYENTGQPGHKEWALDFAAALEQYADGLPTDQWPGGPRRVSEFLENFRSTLPSGPGTPDMEYTLPGAVAQNVAAHADSKNIHVTFETASPVTCRLNAGAHLMHLTPATDTEVQPSQQHSLTMMGLSPATRYYFEIDCAGPDGAAAASSDFWAATLSEKN